MAACQVEEATKFRAFLRQKHGHQLHNLGREELLKRWKRRERVEQVVHPWWCTSSCTMLLCTLSSSLYHRFRHRFRHSSLPLVEEGNKNRRHPSLGRGWRWR